MTEEKILYITIEESNLYKKLLKTDAEVLYQQYGYKRDTCFTHTCRFNNGIEADIKLVLCDEGYPYTEAVLFKNGHQINCSEPCDSMDGKWTFVCGEDKYSVIVKVDEDSESERIFEILETALSSHNYKILDGNADSVFIRSRSTERDFEIKISETAG